MIDPLRQAATAIHRRYMSYANPFSGFLVGAGVGNGKVVVYCRRKPTDEEMETCRALANGADVEFVVSGDMRLCGGKSA